MKPPSLHLHVSGNYFIKWAGKCRYFGRVKADAEERYLRDPIHGLPAWVRWREDRVAERRRHPLAVGVTVLDLIDLFLQTKLAERGDSCREFYRQNLRRFALAYSSEMAALVRPMHLQALKDAMIRYGYAPKTINIQTQAVKTLFRWGADLEHIPLINLRGVRSLVEPPIPNRAMTRTAVRALLDRATGNVRAWLTLAYLTGMRPTETLRVVRGEGEWVGRGVFAVTNKARVRVRIKRHVLFSAEAFGWWRRCEPQWTRPDSYSQASHAAIGLGPHRLRHSAATHLLDAGVPRADADEWLGHYPHRVSLIYMQPRWQYLRRLGRRLSLRTGGRQG